MILWEKRNWNLEFVRLDQNYNEKYVKVEEGSIKLWEMRDKHQELIEKQEAIIWELEFKICQSSEDISELKLKEKKSVQLMQKRKKELKVKDEIVELLYKTGQVKWNGVKQTDLVASLSS